MKIGILGAMLEEIASIKEGMVIEKVTNIAGRSYTEGRVNDQEVVVVFSRWGKVAAACTTTTLINKFDVDFVLFVGVAGAVSDQLRIGDIVIGSGLYQHDMDARPFFDQFQVPLTAKIVFEPNAMDIDRAKNAAERFVGKIQSVFSASLLEKYAIDKPSVHIGLIASGDQFVSDPINHANLKLTHRENTTLAVEMEGASVAQICEDHAIPYLVIRTISDKADHSAVMDFQSFISHVSSRYSAEIINEYTRDLSKCMVLCAFIFCPAVF